jgi:protein-S-isoprenylcysteine O-methyltransferase Ste14
MNTPELSNARDGKRTGGPRWLAYFLVGLAIIGWWGGPWALSLLTPRSGWAAGRASFWNMLGLIPVVLGTVGLFWTMRLHFFQAPARVEWALAQNYLLRHGPYAFTRHPTYLSELTLMVGWVLFYGSLAVLAGFLVVLAILSFCAMPLEERAMEARFGDAYRDYKRRVPRWLGRTRC